MVERRIEKLKQELASGIINEIIKTLGDDSTYSKIRSRYRIQADEIEKNHGIDIMRYFEPVLSSFSSNKKRGTYRILTTLSLHKSSDELISQIKAIIGSVSKVTRTEQVLAELSEVKAAQEVLELMSTAEEYLAKRDDTVENVIVNLMSFKASAFTPAGFEFLLAKALCLIFQVPLYVEYGVEFELEREPAAVWRGRINEQKLDFAPGGMSDIIVYTRSKQYVLVEATLRTTRTQCETEIEPIFTHVSEVAKKHKVGKDIFVVFIAPELLELTYDRLKQLASMYDVIYLDANGFAKVALVSDFIPGLSHYSLTGLLKSLHQVLLSSRTLTMFVKETEKELGRWMSETTQSFINTFMATKVYEKLVELGKLVSIMNLVQILGKDRQVRKYYEIIGVSKEELEEAIDRDIKQFTSYASLLGLIREINGHVEALPIDVYETGLYKTLGKMKKIVSAK